MLTNLVLDLLDFRLAIFPRTHPRASPEVQVAKEGARLVVLLLAVGAEVCPSPVAVLASRTAEGRHARLGCRDSSARLSASSESESVQS
jgi:hypothetical protein